MNNQKIFSIYNIAWLPLWLTLISLLVYPIHFDFYYKVLTEEDGIIEYLTAIFAFVGFFIALGAGLQAYKKRRNKELFVLTLFALGCLFFGGEEISWGQRIFGIEVEEVSPTLHEVNRQEELNIHNIKYVAQIRLVGDVFCLVWGILIPLMYREKTFPIAPLRAFLSPWWLIPGFATTLLITWPKKISTFIFGEMEWVNNLRLGEYKEFCFGFVCMLLAYHFYRTFKDELKKKAIQ